MSWPIWATVSLSIVNIFVLVLGCWWMDILRSTVQILYVLIILLMWLLFVSLSMCLSHDLHAGSCLKRVFTWGSYSKYLYNGWCASASYPIWGAKRASSTGLLTQNKNCFIYLTGVLNKLLFSLMGSFQKLPCKISDYLFYAGLTIQSNHKSFFLYMDTWTPSTGYSIASSYWQGWWSLCFTPCGKYSWNFPINSIFLKSCWTINFLLVSIDFVPMQNNLAVQILLLFCFQMEVI